MVYNAWYEVQYRLDIVHATNGAHIELIKIMIYTYQCNIKHFSMNEELIDFKDNIHNYSMLQCLGNSFKLVYVMYQLLIMCGFELLIMFLY
ncbi:UNVERIFIED_CONTAM: hypothetical protein NCL1_62547 [Trichonephila clavipes]